MRRYLLCAAVPVVAAGTIMAVAAPASASASGSASAARTDGRPTQVVKLTGAEEIPGPGDADGFGFWASHADLKHKIICYAVSVHRIDTPTMAHIHNAPRGVAGGIVVTLQTPAKGFAADCVRAVPDAQQTPANAAVTLTETELANIVRMSDQFYVNVHNAAFPAGAVRGQFR